MIVETIYSYFELQVSLIHAFEATVSIIPPSDELLNDFPHLELLNTTHTISDIVRSWPLGKFWYPLPAWINPRNGLVEAHGQRWFFNVHGSSEVSFHSIPNDVLLDDLLKQLEVNREYNNITFEAMVEVSYDLSRNEITPFFGGTIWEIYLFLDSLDSNYDSEGDTEILLERLVSERKLKKIEINLRKKYLPI